MEARRFEMKKLPIGIQSFPDMIERNFAYVDKTAYIYDMVENGKPYFLARPRRFGKSLLVSTIKAYF
ncbi:AAA family ATPase [Lachnospiraceae bacterium ZAX-1]